LKCSNTIGDEKIEEDDVEKYIKESLAKENMEEDEKKTAALMIKLIGFRTEEVLERANKVQEELKEFDQEIKRAEEELAKNEKKAIYEELKLKLKKIERDFKEVPLNESLAEDNQMDEIEKTIIDNKALLHEANAWIELNKSGTITNSQLNKSLGNVSQRIEEPVHKEIKRKTTLPKTAQKRVTFAEGTKGETKKKTKDELKELMGKAKLNKAVGEAFDQMEHMLNKYNVKK